LAADWIGSTRTRSAGLAGAAVIGRSLSFQLLTEISQIDVDDLFTAIEKAQQVGIIVPSAEGPERPFYLRP
jgi:hypothetical protein